MLLELFITIFVLVSLPKSRALVPNCNYYDTVDISHIKIQNNLYKYDDLVIPANLTAEYDFIEMLDGSKESAKRHLRARLITDRTFQRFIEVSFSFFKPERHRNRSLNGI